MVVLWCICQIWCTFFSILSLTLSSSVLFESNDCLKIIVTLLLEQTQLSYYVIPLTKADLSGKWHVKYHCKNHFFFFLEWYVIDCKTWSWHDCFACIVHVNRGIIFTALCSKEQKRLIRLVLYVQSWIKKNEKMQIKAIKH